MYNTLKRVYMPSTHIKMEQPFINNRNENHCADSDTNRNYPFEKIDIKIENDVEFHENSEIFNDWTGIKHEPESIVKCESGNGVEDTIKTEHCSDSENHSNFERAVDIKQEELIIKSETSDIGVKRYKRYYCDHCNYTTKSIADFRRHTVAIHDRKNAETFQCHHCDFITCHKRNLNRHFRIHSNNQAFTCKFCKKGCNTKQSLDYHILNHHPDQMHMITSTLHSCEICKYTTVCRTRLEDHMYTKHLKTSEDAYTCHICNYKFSLKDSLRAHIVLKHYSDNSANTDKPVQCKLCDYKTCDRSNLKKHARRHSANKKRINCELCNKTFTDKKCYDNHILKLHPENDDLMKTITYTIKKCGKCSYQTSISTNFKNHIKKHNS